MHYTGSFSHDFEYCRFREGSECRRLIPDGGRLSHCRIEQWSLNPILTTNNRRWNIWGAVEAFHISRACGRLGCDADSWRRRKIEALNWKPQEPNLEMWELSIRELRERDYRLFSATSRLWHRRLFNWTAMWKKTANFSKWAAENDLIWFSASEFRRLFDLTGDADVSWYRWYPKSIDYVWGSDAARLTSRMKLGLKARLWRYREARLPNMFSGLGVCSEADRLYLGAHRSIHVIPMIF